MKKILLSLVAAIGIASAANAQLAEGSVFPYPGGTSGGLTAVNAPFTGLRYNLDSLSDAGYTIFIDISATWCPPCWSYHQSKQLDTLWAQHGPAGAPGVNSSTTNDVFVMFFQGEPTSGIAELTYNAQGSGAILYTTTESPQSNITQGNWVAGTPFPIIDDTTSTDASYGTQNVDVAWNIAFFPTVYMVCRDHLVHNLTQPSYTAAYAAAQAGCPTTAPAGGSSVDAKASVYSGNGYYVCNANPSVTFQNYSTTSNITAATITVTDGTGATVATVPWSGSLAPFALATVPVPSFPGSTLGGYKYSVSVAGDITPANNGSADSVFKVYDAGNAAALPFSDDFLSGISYKYTFPADGSIDITNPAWSGCPNPVGTNENQYVYFDFYDFSTYYGGGTFDMAVGNFNTAGMSGVTMSFNEAYAEATGVTGVDAMSVLVSRNCGTTWTTAWTASGAALSTAPATSNGAFLPTSGSQWQLISFNLPVADSNDNLMIRMTGTPGTDYPSNVALVTNINIKQAPAFVSQVNVVDFISVTPNPARDMAYVNVTLNTATNVQVQMYDAVGRMVNSISKDYTAGDQKIELSTTDLAAGLYYVKITAAGNTTTKSLSVVK